MSEERLEENVEYLAPLQDGAQLAYPPRLSESPALRQFALLATWWTVCMEATVAIGFLGLGGSWLFRNRHAVLLLFCATTYAVAPVAGYGWLLLAMGLGQCERDRPVVKSLYVAVFFLVLFYREVPWTELLAHSPVSPVPSQSAA